jgi:NAD(P)-dependent dehydrogenase (short-subunit alcohol dehydrogenase family)
LINNAGVIKKINFEDITPQIFDDTIKVNVRASLFSVQFSLKYLEKSEKPIVINIASLGGLMNWVGYIPYGISKAAEIKLTKMLAKTLAPKIRVNAIAPGTIIIEGEEEGTPSKAPADKIPLKSYGSPKDIVEAIRYLINAEYVTGQVISVEGGRLIS